MRWRVRYLWARFYQGSFFIENTYIMTNSIVLAKDILDFWFGTDETRGKSRPEWFHKNAAFDKEIRTRF